MQRAPLAQLEDWQLEHEEQDLRGRPLLDEHGRSLGRVDEMIVDTDAERVVAIRLDSGREYPTGAFEIHDGTAVLRSDGNAPAQPEQHAPQREPRGAKEATKIALAEEQLRVRKRAVQVGEVEIHKQVKTERRTVDVPLMREEVHVERHEVKPRPADRPIAPEGETIRVPVMAEEAVTEKQPVVTGEVVVTKEPVRETQQVSGTVRRTDVDIHREGDVKVSGDAGQKRGRNEDRR